MKFNIDFQYNILRFILQDKSSKKCIKENVYTECMFDTELHKYIFSHIVDYLNKYDSLPTAINLLQFIEINDAVVSKETKAMEMLKVFIDKLYIPLGEDINFIKEYIISYAQKTAFYKLTLEKTDEVLTNDKFDKDIFDKVLKEMYRIVDMSNVFQENYEMFSLLNDFNKLNFNKLKGYATKFSVLNNALESGGFRPQQLVVFASGPKAGKTTLLVNLAVDFLVNKHLKVLYIDAENGNNRIPRLAYKNILGCSSKELFDGFINKSNFNYNNASYEEKQEIDLLKDVLNRPLYHPNIVPEDALSILLDKYYNDFNSAIEGALFYHIKQNESNALDMKIVKVRNLGTMIEDIYRILEDYKYNDGFEPNIIICDYFDNMTTSTLGRNAQKRDVQARVYTEWKNLAYVTNTVVMSVTQINRTGVNKGVLFGMQDIAESFEKLAIVDNLIGFNVIPNNTNAGVLFNLAARDGSKFFNSYLEYEDEHGVKEKIENVIPLSIDADKCSIIGYDDMSLDDVEDINSIYA